MKTLTIYNTLSRQKEEFKALNPPLVGLYVCGPTVYGEAHLGHARPAITFDILFRTLTHLGYKVRYVRNITDVGHLLNDADDGDDKIAKKAELEKLEPMEVVQRYTLNYHDCMRALGVLPPSIEPRASGHIIEQQQYIQRILENGFAYESGGSIYFDVEKYNAQHRYGKLSGRVVEDMQSNTRQLAGQDEKRGPLDFALWKSAKPEHLMQWPSVWGQGFPGWHLECSTMSEKYLGSEFDIHGGGMDLLFPHHECEIAQSVAANGKPSVHYWMHNNMITINGQKMGKSLGNFITLKELFSGSHALLSQAYSPAVIRFFILQAHYRSPLDFSNEALQAAEKGMQRLLAAYESLETLPVSEVCTYTVGELEEKCYQALLDDLNTPVLISHFFVALKDIQAITQGKLQIDAANKAALKTLFQSFLFDILGLLPEEKPAEASGHDEILNAVIEILLAERLEAKRNKDFAKSDQIRDTLGKLGIEIKDGKEGSSWDFA